MKEDVVRKPKWFQRAKNAGGVEGGKDAVRIENGDAIVYLMDGDSDAYHESYHVSRTGKISGEKKLTEIENRDAINHAANISGGDSKSYYRQQRYGKVQEKEYEKYEQYKKQNTGSSKRERASASSQSNSKRKEDSIVQQNDPVSGTPGYGLMRESDCLDITFDSMESYACNEKTGEIFPVGARPPSPIVSYKVHQALDETTLTLNTTDSDLGISQSKDECGYDEWCVFPGQAENYDLEQNEEPKPDAHSIRINRENSLLDVGLGGNPEEHDIFTAPLERNKQDRLEQLRQSKRSIEAKRIQSQTIVIPRSSLYEREEAHVEVSSPPRSIRRLGAGSAVTEKQAKKYYCCRKFALIATVFFISIGIGIMAMALFWPGKML
jgi:hypothetical protein